MLVFSVSFATIFGAGLALAQSISDIPVSPPCLSTLKELFTSPDAACLKPSALLSFVVGSEQSVPNTIDRWMNGLCASGHCSDESIGAIVSNITSGCEEDMLHFGVSATNNRAKILEAAKVVYPTIRQVICLKGDVANRLCATQVISDLESEVGGLGLHDLEFLNFMTDIQTFMASSLAKIACTDCMKQAFITAKESFPEAISHIDQPFQNVCGSSFIDGLQPDGISQTAASGVFVAQKLNSAGLAIPWRVANLLALSSIFVVISL